MYELFILGKLLHRPMHGYMLQSIVNAALGPFRRLSWGTLYPLLRKLEQSGFIAARGGRSSDKRGIRNYKTTPRGRTRFLELMRSAGDPGGEYRDLFRMKLSNFGHVGIEDQRSILAEYRALLARIISHSEAMDSAVLNAPSLAVAERPYVLKSIDHQRHLAACEIAWVDALAQKTGGKGENRLEKTVRAASAPDGRRPRYAGTRPRTNSRQ